MAIIYKIENKLNHKKYIGQSKLTLEWRLTNKWCGHLVAAENGYKSKLCNALRKYGKDNFTYEVIEERSNSEFSSKELMQQWLNEREIYWIAYYDSQHSGYNQTKGGEYKPNLTLRGKEAQRRAVRAAYATGQPQKKISKSVKLAHKLHPEIIEKIKNKSQNSCWVYKIENGIEEKHFIWTSQLEHYLNKGYIKGLSPSQKECFCYNQKGKPRTKEERSKISKTLTGKKKTLEHAKHISEGQKGKKLSEQTKKNVSIGTKLAMASLSEEKKRQMREKNSAAIKGRKRVTNGKENRYVKGEELEKLLSQGWYYGTGKIYVTNERENKMIYLHELENYLNKGYRRGLKKHENKEN